MHLKLLSAKWPSFLSRRRWVNTLRPRQNGHHFADDIFRCILVNENVWIPIKISLKFVPKGAINNILALVKIMAWRRAGDKPLSEPMMVSLPTHIYVTRPQWVNRANSNLLFEAYWYAQKTLRHHVATCDMCGTLKNIFVGTPKRTAMPGLIDTIPVDHLTLWGAKLSTGCFLI